MNTTTENIIATDKPAVYVGTYAKYNRGSIGGGWVILDGHDRDSFYGACAELHSDEADPEYMFQDYQNFPREFYGESCLADGLWDWLKLDNGDRELLARYCDAIGSHGLTIDDARDAFCGTSESFAEFAAQAAEDCGYIPKDFPAWIIVDWAASWHRNLRHDYVTSEDDDGKIWFFLR
jgi:antirestriction protein